MSTKKGPRRQRQLNNPPESETPIAVTPPKALLTPSGQVKQTLATNASATPSQSGATSKKKNNKQGKGRNNAGHQPEPASNYNGNGQGPVSGSVQSPPFPGQPRATPMKQAYAGPTFHASPAPSALPIPSFFSKSVPEAKKTDGLQARLDQESPGEKSSSEDGQTTPSKSAVSRVTAREANREASPLDFLFDAARQAKSRGPASGSETPQAKSVRLPASEPHHQPQQVSSQHESFRHHARHPTDPSMREMFSLEAEAPPSPSNPIGPAFSTPYQDRMSAFRSQKNPHAPPSGEFEKDKAKVAALKSLLLYPQPQRPSSASPHANHHSNPFDLPPNPPQSRPAGQSAQQNFSAPRGAPSQFQRHYSGSSVPRHQTSGSFPFIPASVSPVRNMSPKQRPPSSQLSQDVTTRLSELPGSDAERTGHRPSNFNAPSSSFVDQQNTRLNNNFLSSPTSEHRSSGGRNTLTGSNPNQVTPSAAAPDDGLSGLRMMLQLDLNRGSNAAGLANGLA